MQRESLPGNPNYPPGSGLALHEFWNRYEGYDDPPGEPSPPVKHPRATTGHISSPHGSPGPVLDRACAWDVIQRDKALYDEWRNLIKSGGLRLDQAVDRLVEKYPEDFEGCWREQ